jgi:hypothetical protein
MIHGVPNDGRIAVPWTLTSRWVDWFFERPVAALRRAGRACGLGREVPQLRMSDEWLEEYERQSRKHPNGT